MPRRHATSLVFLLLCFALSIAAACSPAAPAPRHSEAGAQPLAQATAAPAAPPIEEAKAGEADAALGTAGMAAPANAPRQQRMVIKTAELDILVTDTDTAVDQVLGVVSDVDGFVLNTVTWQEGGLKLAKITLRMPADRYEEALRRLHRLGQVEKESSTGEDVTDQYVDLQSQLRNLQATADRLRGFLDKATTVEEALKVFESLKQFEAAIEQVLGRLNYLGDRASYSTITVFLYPPRPTPTATPTATPTPTPTPVVWRPVRTAQRAGGVLVDVVKVLVDVTIWLVIVLGPFALVLGGLIWLITRSRRRSSQRPEPPEPPASA